MPNRTVMADGVELATESFGHPADPPVLLVMGAMASMLWWPAGFCRRLAARGRRVIRFDNRDTGLSTSYPPGAPPYTIDDMADDALRVLDGWRVPVAHLVGMSLGGMIAQIAALKHPDRVATLTVISSTPVGVDAAGPSPATADEAGEAETVGIGDRAALVDSLMRDARMLAGTAFPHDEAAARALIEADIDRARNFASAGNHVRLQSVPPAPGGLAALQAPLLVIHGTVDPVFPVEHGRALMEAAPTADLLVLDGGGHELHPGHWDRIVAQVVAHTGRVRRSRSASRRPGGDASRSGG